jgi:inorganic pyrophosphatase
MDTVLVMVETPTGSRNKYEYDAETGRFYLDRMLFSAVHYPADYGFILETLGGDGDPLDALTLVGEPTFPGCIIRARPVGVLRMSDEHAVDDKILCLPVRDPQWNWVRSVNQVPTALRQEIRQFFEVYKDLEGKITRVAEWQDETTAWQMVHEASRLRSHRGATP